MSHEALDLQRSFRIVRRHFKLFGTFVILGLLIGAAYAVVKPPARTSTALVVLPQVTGQAATAQGSTAAEANVIDTQLVVAVSDPVLSGALPHVSPAMSLRALRSKVGASNQAGSVIAISASSSTSAQAEAMANAVANSYMAYVNGPQSPVGHMDARLLEPAATATRPSLLEWMAIDGVLGALAGVLVGYIVTLAVGRRERRLAEREPIANSIGIPVIGSFPVAHPSDAAGWTKLLEEYSPDAVDAQRMRATLDKLGLTDKAQGDGDGAASSVSVLSFASDPAALALGPQLASFAASQGIPAALVIGSRQDTKAVAALRSAGAASPVPEGRRRLYVVVSGDGDGDGDVAVPSAARLVVVVAVVDAHAPRMPESVRTDATVLALSAGVATAGQLVQVASAAAVADQALVGILIANPVAGDQTTGRNPRLGQPVRRPVPTRV